MRSHLMRAAHAPRQHAHRRHDMPFGAQLQQDGVRFRLWAPAARGVELALRPGPGSEPQHHVMAQTSDGWFELVTAGATAGSRYRYRVSADAGSLLVPDPASRYNPDDVHGDSEVIDPSAFTWKDQSWKGRPWHEAVVYELHVGAFSPRGDFAGVEARLGHLHELGVTAIELMPLADFPGARNWGYDGVLPFAPDASYGRPDDLKQLVQAAHAAGLMVLLDVVYNHFGPEGNYLHAYAPQFFTDRHQTPWGAAMNFDGDRSRTVRDFFINNALYWLEEFHFDGLRFDAVHAIPDESRPDFLSELADAVRRGPGRHRHVHLVLENDLNQASRLRRNSRAQPLHYDAQWNDDMHHVAHVLLTGERDGYYADYAADPVQRLGRCLAEGFAYQGEPSPFRQGQARGEPSASLPPLAFVNFLQNHDQVGNRAFGERIAQLADASALRGALAMLLLAPAPPMLFMGEEFGARTPFLFFCDFEAELARAVNEGRRREFAAFERFRDPAVAAAIPDPCAPESFRRSKLDWSSVDHEAHAQWLACYRELLALRQQYIVPLLAASGVAATHNQVSEGTLLEVCWRFHSGEELHLHANLGAEPKPLSSLSRAGAAAPQRPVYASPEAIGAGGVAPWAVIWTIREPEDADHVG